VPGLGDLRHRQSVADHRQRGLIPLLGHAGAQVARSYAHVDTTLTRKAMDGAQPTTQLSHLLALRVMGGRPTTPRRRRDWSTLRVDAAQTSNHHLGNAPSRPAAPWHSKLVEARKHYRH
jgi:hypothetical protein